MSRKLRFMYSAMNAGKTSSLIQSAFNYVERGMDVLILTSVLDTRYGTDKVASRVGLEMPAIAIDKETDIISVYQNKENVISCIFVDEAQFLTKEQVNALAHIVDHENVPVLCYGIRTDFRGNTFEGSAQLLAIADDIIELKSICHCGKKASMNARITNETTQVSIGGNESYESMCRFHFMEHLNQK